MKQDLIVRHCQECGKNFVTGNRAQRFCCEKCNAAFYYQVRKKMPAYLSQVEEDPAAKTHFTITETSDILGVSVSTVYRLLKSRKLHAERLSKKETLVSLKSIESYKSYLKSDEILAQQNAYSIHELMELTGVGMTSAYSIIKKHHIRKVRFKKFVGYNKEDVNSFIETMPRKREHWINFKEVCELLNCDDKYRVMFFLVNYRIPRRKRANVFYYLQEEIIEKNQDSHKHFNISL
jgi:excisionase family DNA binding protein